MFIASKSFVTRLERARTGLLDDVLFFGKGGATSISLIHSDVFKKFMATDVSKVFLQVAGNDIPAMSTLEGIVGNIDQLVRRILEKPDPPTIIIGSIFYRYRPRGMTATDYNIQVEALNEDLARKYRQHPKVHFWSLRGLRPLKRSDFVDGVHLNRTITWRFARQVRLALFCQRPHDH
ncbi:hypothetical protein KP79_PYT23628 [Mizuhopecten yessoensis]|uniref:SGNH hydrolase-type esterase domain-containing protein n=1 Tax=Mizuhopecten yessoensis TaxID=6573 RepID=A0A210Q8W7_MIZYE|nr:hypothetical protein KP79_PYT23628 [Mizuhopecten yessoensis]